MKRLHVSLQYIICFLLIVSVVMTFPLQSDAKLGESLQAGTDEPLNITAENLMYFPDDNLFVAEGSVTITYRSGRLTAERIEFNEVTGKALAIGNVVYEEGGEVITAEQAEFDLDDEQGIINMGELALEDDQYITGREIQKIGEKTYVIKKGTFTACDSPRPAWQFRSSRAKIHQGEYLQAWNTVGYVKGIPVFYFPYFVFPIKTKRQTGFLVPDIGSSSSNGFTLGNSFFWAITDSQDATFGHTYYENRGHRFDLEYRYKYSKETEGTFDGSFIRDQLDSTEKTRLEWSHRQGLPYSITGRVNLDLSSDDNFDEDFDTSLDERTDRKLDSNVSFTKSFSQHSVRLEFDRLDDLGDDDDDRRDQRFPELTITSQKQQLFGTPFYIQQTTEMAWLKREGSTAEQLEFGRVDIQPTLSLPLNLFGQALTISPQLQLRETYYTRNAETAQDTDLDAESTHREYYTVSMNVYGPKFNRIFDFGTTRRLQKIKHLIEPSINFQYRPSVDNDDLPKFDSIDSIGSSSRSRTVSYSISQRLLTKQVKKAEWDKYLLGDDDLDASELATETDELASLSLSQSYDFEAEDYPFSNISATLKTEPFDDYDFSLQATYDVYMNTFVSTSIDFDGELWDNLAFDLTWRRTLSVDRDADVVEDVYQYLDVYTHLSLFDRLGLSYRGRFNIEDNERIEDNIGFTYNAQCWNITGNYTQQLIGDDRDNSFQILLELKHLGKLFDIKG